MMDKELLEFAAKAAEIELGWIEIDENDKDCDAGAYCYNEQTGFNWNPIDDDGDAMRLAVKFEMKVYVGEAYPWDKECAEYSHRFAGICDEDEEKDPYAATRRAIVRAAAEIGKTL